MVRRLGSAMLMFCLHLAWGSAAFGQALDPREIEARKDCLAGKYEAGIDLLAELFAETGNPNFVYNQARCYEASARPVDAIHRFREYLRVAPNASNEEKADVESHIGDCRAMQAEQDKKNIPREPPAPSPLAATAAPIVPLSTASVNSIAEAAEPATNERKKGASLRTTGVVLGVTGAGAAAAGVVFSVLTNNIKNQVESDGRKGFFDPAKDALGRTYATLQWVGYGVGAVAILAGAITYTFGYQSGQQDTGQSVVFIPMVGPGRGGALLQGRF
jgi:hypothetical protein